MKKHTKLFYRCIARIRVVNEKRGCVYLERIKKHLKISYDRAVYLEKELLDAGVIRSWTDVIHDKRPQGEEHPGNIIWENLRKFHVPKEITEKEKILFAKDKHFKRTQA